MITSSNSQINHHYLAQESDEQFAFNPENPPIEALKKFQDLLSDIGTRSQCDNFAKDLKTHISTALTSHEVARAIFEVCHRHYIVSLIDTLCRIDSNFELSPFDHMRYLLLKHQSTPNLDNRSFNKHLQEQGLEKDAKAISRLYQMAYDLNHPFIYQLSSRAIAPHEYTLNFLWINLNPQDRIRNEAQHIFQDGLNPAENSEYINNPAALRSMEKNDASLLPHEAEQWKSIQKSFLYGLSKWADLHPDGSINLWYDSALVTQQAQAKTFEMLKGMAQSRSVNLQLRDIRQLPNLKDELLNLTHPAVPIYVRIDHIKVMVIDYMLSSPQEKAKYCVVTDIDVAPMTAEEMFEQRTQDYLEEHGYVFNKVGVVEFENSFFIFNKEKEGIRYIHYEKMIEKTIKKIKELREHPIESQHGIGSRFFMDAYCWGFFIATKELEKGKPRKLVACPPSVFNWGGEFLPTDHRSEIFRFSHSENIPYTKFGRSGVTGRNDDFQPIPELRDWQLEPLPSLSSN